MSEKCGRKAEDFCETEFAKRVQDTLPSETEANELQTIRAENARLREALDEIAALFEKDFSSTFPTYSYLTIKRIRQYIADRAAKAAMEGSK